MTQEDDSILVSINYHLSRIADALETIARPGSDTKPPDYLISIDEFQSFDWQSIGATIIKMDRDGPTHVSWNGQVYTRRSPSNKFDPAIWFSRAAGRNEEGETEYARLITFREIKDADPLPDKARYAVNQSRQSQPTQPPTQSPKPGASFQAPANGANGSQNKAPAPQPTPSHEYRPVSFTEYLTNAKSNNITREAAIWIAQQANVSPENDHAVPNSYLRFFYEAKHVGYKLSEAWETLKKVGFDTTKAISSLPK